MKEDFNERYKIVVFGKNGGKKIGRYNFSNSLARGLERLGHEIYQFSYDVLYKIIPQYDLENCLHFKKPINIKQIQYECDPDFIFIEQTYYRYDISEVTCPVIYQHREYTHFPDITNPDILLASYHWRLQAFEYYYPWEYHNIPYKDYLYVAVDDHIIKPQEKKTISGITHIGSQVPMWQFRQANGPFADMVMEQQEKFWEECIDEGYVGHIPTGLSGEDFLNMLGKCEAVLYDAGRFAGFSRVLIEAMAKKTLCVVRIHTPTQKTLYERLGLTDEMCFFVETPEDVGKIKFTEEQRKEMTEKAYEWVISNHTYDVRARQLIEMFEKFKAGEKKQLKFMGWALRHKAIHEGDGVIID